MIKTFRGQFADGGQDRIRLQTIKGKVGYRIVKFKIIDDEPGEIEVEMVGKIYTQEQDTVDNTVNFSDSTLLGVALYANQGNQSVVSSEVIIFDRSIVNQDIFITGFSWEGAPFFNYYLELEVIPLDDAGAEYTTLKDMRQS